MYGEPHDLHHEFPELGDKIHELKMSNAHFSKLFEEYDTIVKELHRIEEQIETPADDYVESLKKKRLKLKDDLYEMLIA